MNDRDFLRDLQLASAHSELPLSELARAIDPDRERLPDAAMTPESLIDELNKENFRQAERSATVHIYGVPIAVFLFTCLGLAANILVFLYVIKPAIGFSWWMQDSFSGLWQVQTSLVVLALLTLMTVPLCLVTLVSLSAQRTSWGWPILRHFFPVSNLHRLQDLPMKDAKDMVWRTGQMRFETRAAEETWRSQVFYLVFWVFPTVLFAVLWPHLKSFTMF